MHGRGHRGFRRTVGIVQHCLGARGEPSGQVRGQRLSADRDVPQRPRQCERRFREEQREHRRHEFQDRDVPPVGHPHQVFGITMSARRGNHQSSTDLEWIEQLPHRRVERDGRLVQHRVAIAERVAATHPLDLVHHRAVADRDAFRSPGGSGREDYVREILGPQRRPPGRVGHRLRVEDRQVQDVDFVGVHRRRQVTTVRGRGQHHDGLRGRNHVLGAVCRMFRIQRQVPGTGFERGVNAHHHLEGATHAQPHQRLRSHPS
ncbi:hypothetical protein MLGJGCBP_03547 [Rhodococcus sp. T7]|nr:hypothetical protein MLGJGCBP_03547 [Rhodococcus sp. T7]